MRVSERRCYGVTDKLTQWYSGRFQPRLLLSTLLTPATALWMLQILKYEIRLCDLHITILCLSYASSTLARMRPLMVVKINCGRGLFSGHPYSIFRVHWVLAPCCWSGQPDTIRITHTLSNQEVCSSEVRRAPQFKAFTNGGLG